MTSTMDYINFSALAYVDFNKNDEGHTLGSIISDEQNKSSRKNFGLDDPEFVALKDPSNPLRSYVLLAQSKFATAFAMTQLGQHINNLFSKRSMVYA